MTKTLLQIKNDKICATFDQTGAELISLKDVATGLEFLWQADADFWGRHAPILFPIVGKLKGDKYTYAQREYALSQHGFARDQVFTVQSDTSNSLSFLLSSSEKMKKSYPFDFELLICYQIHENHLVVNYRVTNKGTCKMYFGIGGHPAFNVPLDSNRDFEDYHIKIESTEPMSRLPLDGAYIHLEKKTEVQTLLDIPLKHEIFSQDALIYATNGSTKLTLEAQNSASKVVVSYDQMPFVGLWSPFPQKAPFVCLEPWHGLADTIDSKGELTQKFGINQLAPNCDFECSYTIQFETK